MNIKYITEDFFTENKTFFFGHTFVNASCNIQKCIDKNEFFLLSDIINRYDHCIFGADDELPFF